MSDPAFVVAGYAVVLGGLALYAWKLRERLRVARGLARSIEVVHGSQRAAASLDSTSVPEGEGLA